MTAPARPTSDARDDDQLAPAIAEIAKAGGVGELCAALALVDGFQLDLVVCPSSREADALLVWLPGEIERRRGERVVIRRVQPARAQRDVAMTPHELTDSVVSQLVAPRAAHSPFTIVALDSTGGGPDERDAWRWLFHRFNERRNTIVRLISAPVLWLLPPDLDAVFPGDAPDVWSIRTSTLRLPSTARPSPDRPDQTGGDKRERILVGAERVFARQGFFAARVSEIAKEAGVADGTIYLYFKSKEDLLISLFERRMTQVNAELLAAIHGLAPRAQLRAFIHAYLHMVSNEPVAAEVLTLELRMSSKFMKEYDNRQFAELLRLLASIIAQGQAQGELSSAIPSPIAARIIFGILDEIALVWLLARQPAGKTTANSTRTKKFDIAHAADWVMEFVTNGLDNKSHRDRV